MRFHSIPLLPQDSHKMQIPDTVLSAPQILGLPLLLLANKQDSSNSLSVEEIRNDYEDWYQRKIESARRDRQDDGDAARRERIASLDVMGVSAIEGYATTCSPRSSNSSILLGRAYAAQLTGCFFEYRTVEGMFALLQASAAVLNPLFRDHS